MTPRAARRFGSFIPRRANVGDREVAQENNRTGKTALDIRFFSRHDLNATVRSRKFGRRAFGRVSAAATQQMHTPPKTQPVHRENSTPDPRAVPGVRA